MIKLDTGTNHYHNYLAVTNLLFINHASCMKLNFFD